MMFFWISTFIIWPVSNNVQDMTQYISGIDCISYCLMSRFCCACLLLLHLHCKSAHISRTKCTGWYYFLSSIEICALRLKVLKKVIFQFQVLLKMILHDVSNLKPPYFSINIFAIILNVKSSHCFSYQRFSLKFLYINLISWITC